MKVKIFDIILLLFITLIILKKFFIYETFFSENIKNFKKINLKNLDYYFLTYNNIKRKKHMTHEFQDVNLIEVNPDPNQKGRFKSAVSGWLRILNKGISNQNKNSEFKPFIILEDDVKKYRDFPKEIEVPIDTDLLYIGLSSEGINKKTMKGETGTKFKIINKDIIKLDNMLSTHGLIILSLKGLNILKKSLINDMKLNRGYDISLTLSQPKFNVFALRKPLVYQYGKVGGKEKFTKIEY